MPRLGLTPQGAGPAVLALAPRGWLSGLSGRGPGRGGGHDQHPIRIGVKHITRPEFHPGKADDHLGLAGAALLALAGEGTQGLDAQGHVGHDGAVADIAMHQHPGPAVIHRPLGQQVAEHGAARRGVGLDDQHPTLAGFVQQFPDLGIVVRAAHRGDGAVEIDPPAIVAEEGGADLGMIPPGVAQISGFQAMQCHGRIPRWGLGLWFAPGYRVPGSDRRGTL